MNFSTTSWGWNTLTVFSRPFAVLVSFFALTLYCLLARSHQTHLQLAYTNKTKQHKTRQNKEGNTYFPPTVLFLLK
jgi:hypothetical protein